MLILVYGGAGSGKSEYAERLIVESGLARRTYIATMEPYGEAAAARIARHRKLRADKEFETVECFRGLAALSLPQGGAALLEDLTNLLANEWFGGERAGAAQRVLDGLARLPEAAALAVVVANDLFTGGLTYDPETEAFLEALYAVHRAVAARADAVYEVVCGIPLRWKGATP